MEPNVATTIAEYSKTAVALSMLQQKYKGVKYDVSTGIGMKSAITARAELRSLRVGLEKYRKELNEDDRQRVSNRNTEAKRLTAIIEEYEVPFDNDIKAEEEKKEKERQDKIETERIRVEMLQSNIQKIRDLPMSMTGKTSTEISTMLDYVRTLVITDAYQELQLAAQNAREMAMQSLTELFQSTIAREQEATRLAEERKELDRLRAEQDQRNKDAEDKRLADEATARTEKTRVDGIQAEINILRTRHLDAVGLGSKALEELIASYKDDDIDNAVFQEFTDEAFQLNQAGISMLTKFHAAAVDREDREAKLKADQEAHDARVKKDTEEREAREREAGIDQDRIDQEARDLKAEEDRKKIEDAEKQAKIDADAREEAEAARKIAARKLKLSEAKRESAEAALGEIFMLASDGQTKPVDTALATLEQIATIAEANLPAKVPNEPSVKNNRRKKDKVNLEKTGKGE